MCLFIFFFFFFFQAEDGIRDVAVTGVQTCALPISPMKKLKMLMTIAAVVLVAAAGARAQFFARDPGVRVGPAGAGGMLDGLTGLQPDFFTTGLGEFEEADGLAEGLGPRFNLDSCVGCHSQPAAGGTSPEVNPHVAGATALGA